MPGDFDVATASELKKLTAGECSCDAVVAMVVMFKVMSNFFSCEVRQ